MDYEKKYNDALNLAKSYYGNGCNEFLDTIFPELSESEDERVREWIYNLIGSLGDPQDEDAEKELEEMKPLALEYLEKQKPVQLEEEKEYIRTLKSRVADFLRGKDKDEVDTTYYQRICDWLDGRHVEQKPAEWSEEDDQLIGFIFDLLNDLVWRKDWAMSKEECLKRLKSLRPSWKPSEEQMEALDKALYYVPEEIGIPIAEIYGHFNKMKKKLI